MYDPEFGYYSSGKAAIGFAGADFFTNVSCGPAFGKILALQFEKVWRAIHCPVPFFLIEQGANDGRLAADILTAAQNDQPEFFAALRLRILEPIPVLRERQAATLKPWRSILEIADPNTTHPPVPGVFYCNELIDALPFALVAHDGTEWREKRVTLDGKGNFQWLLVPIERHDLAVAIQKIPTPKITPYETEIRPAIFPWFASAVRRLSAGAIYIFDYGFSREVLYAPERTKGTLLCYRNHKRDENPLTEIGMKDISAHVDFSALQEAAQHHGLSDIYITDQHHFLVRAAESWLRDIDGKPLNAATARLLRNFRMLMHPETLGRAFLVFSANIPYRALTKGQDPFGCN